MSSRLGYLLVLALVLVLSQPGAIQSRNASHSPNAKLRYSLFDYNLLQYEDLSREHVDALLAISLDPTLADTVLVVGTVSTTPPVGSTPGNA